MLAASAENVVVLSFIHNLNIYKLLTANVFKGIHANLISLHHVTVAAPRTLQQLELAVDFAFEGSSIHAIVYYLSVVECLAD